MTGGSGRQPLGAISFSLEMIDHDFSTIAIIAKPAANPRCRYDAKQDLEREDQRRWGYVPSGMTLDDRCEYVAFPAREMGRGKSTNALGRGDPTGMRETSRARTISLPPKHAPHRRNEGGASSGLDYPE